MKQKLQAELKDLANKILNTEKDPVISDLKFQARELYEKLTVLTFAEENINAITSPKAIVKNSEEVFLKEDAEKESPSKQSQPSIQMNERSQSALASPSIPVTPVSEVKDEYLPDGTEYNSEADPITEPNTEKIKDIVAHMPPETQNLDHMISNIITKNGVDKFTEVPPAAAPARDFRDIGVDYDNLPAFEPVKKNEKDRPRSLNDRLKKGINIGLNERLAFIRHLFDGKTADYNRVISQLNSFDSVTEAKKFIQMVVKPDYKNWVGKEEYEKKFLELVENKFKH